jgi:hypothetical protein
LLTGRHSFGQIRSSHAGLLGLGKNTVGLFLFPYVMLDLLRQHFYFGFEVFVSWRTAVDLDDQRLGAVMLDLRFLEQPLLHVTFAGRIKDLFFN